MSENTPVEGCPGCDTTGGRMSCPFHGGLLVWNRDGPAYRPFIVSVFEKMFGVHPKAEVERLQGLLADADREFNRETLRAEALEARVKEMQRKLDEASMYCSILHFFVKNNHLLLNGLEPDGLLELGKFLAERALRGEER